MIKNIDERIIDTLRQHARMPSSELARRLDVSRATVQNRIKNLEQTGIIQGYTVVLGDNYQREQISAHVLIEVEQRLTAQVGRKLQTIPQISAIYAVSGNYDLIVVLEAASTPVLNQLLDRIGSLEGVIRTNSSVVLETKLRR